MFNSDTKAQQLIPLIYGALIFLITIILAGFYTAGDQVHYSDAYTNVYKLAFIDAYNFYGNRLSSQEFVHFFLIWSLGEYIEKNTLMSIANGIFAYLATIIMLRLKANKFIVLSILIFSFYPLVLFLAAERLKFGFILFFLSIVLYQDRREKLAILASAISITAHIQLLINYLSILFGYFIHLTNDFLKKGALDKKIIFIPLLGGLSLYLMSEQIAVKLEAHIDGFTLIDIIKVVILFSLTLFYKQEKPLTIAYLFIPLLIATMLMGADRIVFFGYFIFLYYGLQVNGGVNIGVVATLLYGFYKTSIFLFSLFSYGYGFACSVNFNCA